MTGPETAIEPTPVRLVCGGAGESVVVAAATERAGERWFIHHGAHPQQGLSAYASRLPSRRAAVRPQAEAGWNSWYELWDTVDEAAMRANAALAAEVLEPLLGPLRPAGAPALRFVVDDGWQQAWGEWTPNAKFPSGFDGLARDLHAEGYEEGVWLAPLLVDEDSALVGDHPDWFVGGAVYHHTKSGPMRVLDVTHPDAAQHLREVIEQLEAWGMTLLKIDFLFVGTWEGARAVPATGMEAYAQALALIREAAGEDVLLLAVGAPGTPSLPFVDGWRQGGDIALEPFGPSWPFVADQARSLSVHWPLSPAPSATPTLPCCACSHSHRWRPVCGSRRWVAAPSSSPPISGPSRPRVRRGGCNRTP